jgi:hypothetical protein
MYCSKACQMYIWYIFQYLSFTSFGDVIDDSMQRFSKVSQHLFSDSMVLYLEKLFLVSSSILKALKDPPHRIQEILHNVS